MRVKKYKRIKKPSPVAPAVDVDAEQQDSAVAAAADNDVQPRPDSNDVEHGDPDQLQQPYNDDVRYDDSNSTEDLVPVATDAAQEADADAGDLQVDALLADDIEQSDDESIEVIDDPINVTLSGSSATMDTTAASDAAAAAGAIDEYSKQTALFTASDADTTALATTASTASTMINKADTVQAILATTIAVDEAVIDPVTGLAVEKKHPAADLTGSLWFKLERVISFLQMLWLILQVPVNPWPAVFLGLWSWSVASMKYMRR